MRGVARIGTSGTYLSDLKPVKDIADNIREVMLPHLTSITNLCSPIVMRPLPVTPDPTAERPAIIQQISPFQLTDRKLSFDQLVLSLACEAGVHPAHRERVHYNNPTLCCRPKRTWPHFLSQTSTWQSGLW